MSNNKSSTHLSDLVDYNIVGVAPDRRRLESQSVFILGPPDDENLGAFVAKLIAHLTTTYGPLMGLFRLPSAPPPSVAPLRPAYHPSKVFFLAVFRGRDAAVRLIRDGAVLFPTFGRGGNNSSIVSNSSYEGSSISAARTFTAVAAERFRLPTADAERNCLLTFMPLPADVREMAYRDPLAVTESADFMRARRVLAPVQGCAQRLWFALFSEHSCYEVPWREAQFMLSTDNCLLVREDAVGPRMQVARHPLFPTVWTETEAAARETARAAEGGAGPWRIPASLQRGQQGGDRGSGREVGRPGSRRSRSERSPSAERHDSGRDSGSFPVASASSYAGHPLARGPSDIERYYYSNYTGLRYVFHRTYSSVNGVYRRAIKPFFSISYWRGGAANSMPIAVHSDDAGGADSADAAPPPQRVRRLEVEEARTDSAQQQQQRRHDGKRSDSPKPSLLRQMVEAATGYKPLGSLAGTVDGGEDDSDDDIYGDGKGRGGGGGARDKEEEEPPRQQQIQSSAPARTQPAALSLPPPASTTTPAIGFRAPASLAGVPPQSDYSRGGGPLPALTAPPSLPRALNRNTNNNNNSGGGRGGDDGATPTFSFASGPLSHSEAARPAPGILRSPRSRDDGGEVRAGGAPRRRRDGGAAGGDRRVSFDLRDTYERRAPPHRPAAASPNFHSSSNDSGRNSGTSAPPPPPPPPAAAPSMARSLAAAAAAAGNADDSSLALPPPPHQRSVLSIDRDSTSRSSLQLSGIGGSGGGGGGGGLNSMQSMISVSRISSSSSVNNSGSGLEGVSYSDIPLRFPGSGGRRS